MYKISDRYLKTEGLVRVYTDRRTEKVTDMPQSTQLVKLIVYISILEGLRHFLLGVTNLIQPVQGIKMYEYFFLEITFF